MPGLTAREASRIEEGLHLEEMLINKFSVFARQANDPECRRVLTDILSLHQRHHDMLRRQVGTVGIGPGYQIGAGQVAGAGGYQTSVTGV